MSDFPEEDFILPQPVSSSAVYKKRGDKSFGWSTPTDVFLERQHLALPMAQIVSVCSALEHRLSAMYAVMLGSHAPVAFAIFSKVITVKSQIQAISSAASTILNERTFDLFQAVTQEARASIEQRNQVVHARWGVSSDFPKDILWLDRDEEMNKEVAFATMEINSRNSPHVEPSNKYHTVDSILVYKEKDLINIKDRLLKAYTFVVNLSVLVDSRIPPDESIYQQLERAPQLAPILARLQNSRRTQPPKP